MFYIILAGGLLFILLMVGVLIWLIRKVKQSLNQQAQPIALKESETQTVRDFFPIQNLNDLSDHTLETDKNYIRIAEIGSINPYAKSEEELQVLFQEFQSCIMTLESPLQILIQTRQVDISEYMDYFVPFVQQTLEEFGEDHTMSLYAQHLEQHLRETNQDKQPIRRNYTVHSVDKTDEWELDVADLLSKFQLDIMGIANCGLKVKPLHKVDVLEVLQGFIAKPRASTAKIRDAFRKDVFQLRVQSDRKNSETKLVKRGDENVHAI